jgi:tripartite-type tricarboxylate transporter receptor subunit TctC
MELHLLAEALRYGACLYPVDPCAPEPPRQPFLLLQLVVSRGSHPDGVRLSTVNAIHYPNGGEQIAAVLGSHVTAGVGGVPEFASQIKSGKLGALAVSSLERLAGLDVPTRKEQGVALVFGTWRGLMSQRQATDAE